MASSGLASRIQKTKVALEIVLFAGSTVALAALSENGLWWWFGVVAVVCASLFAVLRVAESGPGIRTLQELERRQTELVRRLTACGVVRWFDMQDVDQVNERNDICRQIVDRGTSFALSGSTGASYVDPATHRHWPNVKRRLDSGATFRLLLTDPFSDSKKLRNRLNGVRTLLDPKLDLANVIRLTQRYSNFEVRLTTEVYCSVFYSDHEMIYDPYHLGAVGDRLENVFFALQLSPTHGRAGPSYFDQLRSHFEFLWREGQTLHDFVAQHREDLAPFLDPSGDLA
ncbi:hypothetical protein ACI78T_13965 [Blastococcus sp. SYSU D00922]